MQKPKQMSHFTLHFILNISRQSSMHMFSITVEEFEKYRSKHMLQKQTTLQSMHV